MGIGLPCQILPYAKLKIPERGDRLGPQCLHFGILDAVPQRSFAFAFEPELAGRITVIALHIPQQAIMPLPRLILEAIGLEPGCDSAAMLLLQRGTRRGHCFGSPNGIGRAWRARTGFVWRRQFHRRAGRGIDRLGLRLAARLRHLVPGVGIMALMALRPGGGG